MESAPAVAVQDEAPDVASDVTPEAAPGTPPVVRLRRRALRTVGLIAVAAVIGLVGGTATGYGIQAEREPTQLPPLNEVGGLAYPKPLPRGQEPEPLSAAEDRQVKVNGDLRKLLLPRPNGARADGVDGWESLSEYVSDYTLPASALEHQLDLGIRRIASRSWLSGEHRSVTIELVQFRPGSMGGARVFVRDQQEIVGAEDRADSVGMALEGSGNGRSFIYPVQRRAGYTDLYEARAYVQRGDIAVVILMSDARKIAEKDIASLAERQLERL
ncbi:hypothetical protein AB0B30_29395 [Streptomyces narbonensis]|uniref:Serine/threonine protein kinase n=1 Tax=Streptomyces narbonensis TaxID=67333 RepID=A0ABV3CEE1_9ACTN